MFFLHLKSLIDVSLFVIVSARRDVKRLRSCHDSRCCRRDDLRSDHDDTKAFVLFGAQRRPGYVSKHSHVDNREGADPIDREVVISGGDTRAFHALEDNWRQRKHTKTRASTAFPSLNDPLCFFHALTTRTNWRTSNISRSGNMLNIPFASLAVVLYLYASFARAAPSPAAFSTSLNIVKESINPPRGWVQGPPAPEHHTIKLSIALPQPRFGELEAHLQEVSDPAHARYGQHLSKADVDALVTPHQDSLDSVDDWLTQHGLGDEDMVRSDGMDWVTIRVTIGTAEKMLDTVRRRSSALRDIFILIVVCQKYHIWIHEESGDVVVRTLSYSLPESVHAHVELVQPTTMFARFKPEMASLHYFPSVPDALEPITDSIAAVLGQQVPSSTTAVSPTCNSIITLECLQDLYGTKGYTPQAADKNALGITGYLEQFANLQDLKQFYAQQLPQAVNTSFTFVSVAGEYLQRLLTYSKLKSTLFLRWGEFTEFIRSWSVL